MLVRLYGWVRLRYSLMMCTSIQFRLRGEDHAARSGDHHPPTFCCACGCSHQLSLVALCRYAITLSVPKGSVRKGIYFDTANPHHAVRLLEGGDGRKDLLLVSGEEHDQGIKPEEYADYFGRCSPSYICLCPGLGQVLCVFAVACFVISCDCIV